MPVASHGSQAAIVNGFSDPRPRRGNLSLEGFDHHSEEHQHQTN
jgi:hypothetical protein